MTAPTTTATADLTALSGDYVVDATHSRIGFVARHAMVTKVRGDFTAFEGRATLDFADPARSTAEAVIEVASVDTRNEQRDEHLRTNDFFDASNHPQITFRSTGVEVVDAENARVTGDLTIKGTTRPVTFDVEVTGASKDPFGNTRVG
ncbi:MAG TPA: YceI family protein, partial [Mycobacteriales bacterium]|nr:YceI family protein [Mycobacteriales bacterium]